MATPADFHDMEEAVAEQDKQLVALQREIGEHPVLLELRELTALLARKLEEVRIDHGIVSWK